MRWRCLRCGERTAPCGTPLLMLCFAQHIVEFYLCLNPMQEVYMPSYGVAVDMSDRVGVVVRVIGYVSAVGVVLVAVEIAAVDGIDDGGVLLFLFFVN